MQRKPQKNGIQTYSDDAPRRTLREDRLGMVPFARRLADVIRTMPASNGYVIGLHGVWGSGKSTVLNFVETYLLKAQEEGDDPIIQLVQFRPWIISSHQDLVAAFFKVLGEAIDPKQERKKRRFRLFKKRAKAGVTPLLTAISAAGAVADPSAATATATKLASAPLDKLFDLWMKEPSLQAAHEELKIELRKRDARLLVVIDDIDRLERDAIRTVMRLVKSVGQLPNVIYLLAYDRRVVWSALEDDLPTGRDRPSFAEKIVQQEIDLPIPSKQAILAMFDEEAKFLLSAIDGDDSMRWFRLVQHGIHRWLQQPRDVNRLANALRFCVPPLISEVDPHDVLAMEGLRLYDRSAFEWIRLSRSFFFPENTLRFADDKYLDDYGRRFRESLPESDKDEVIAVLCDLFPHVAHHIAGKKVHLIESSADVLRRRGVGTPLGYDAYFSLFVSQEVVSKSKIDDAFQHLGDEQLWVGIISDYAARKDSSGGPLVPELFKEILVRLGARRRVPPTQELLNALLVTGDTIISIDRPNTFLSFPPRASWLNLIDEILEMWGPDIAGPRLLVALSASTSPAVWAEIYIDRAREFGVINSPNSAQRQRIDRSSFEKFGVNLLHLIKTTAAHGSLDEAPLFHSIIAAWNYLEGNAPVRTWIEQGIQKSPRFLVTLSKTMLNYSTHRDGKRYMMRERPKPELYDLQLLRGTAERYLEQHAYTGDDQNAVRALLEGSETFLAGKTPNT